MASTLTSTSTDAEVWASYDDNASYEEDSSRAKALAFVTACRILLRRRPNRVVKEGEEIEFNDRAITQELNDVRQWLSLNPSTSAGAGVHYADLRDFRDSGETGDAE